MTGPIVVVGGGLAGAKAAEALRQKGFDGPLTLVGAERHPPYERPPLSKSYLAGRTPFDEAIVHPATWYADHGVELRLGVIATAVDPTAHQVSLTDGSSLHYAKLLLATGSTPRRLPIPGADAPGVLTLRTREDADAIRAAFGPNRHLVIIGGGWIGLEVAAAARGADTEVSVIEVASLPLLGVLGPELAQVFADLHRAHGVDLYLGSSVSEIAVEHGRAAGVRLDDATHLRADAVLIGVGAAPNLALAETARLKLDNGVLVNASLCSSDPDIYAAGDIANHDHPTLGTRIRVEHWATALNQPATAAAAMLGEQVSYTELPYFYTDQYDLGMEYLGHAPPDSYHRIVVRGDLAAREFVAFWLDAADRLTAVMNVNVWDVIEQVKPLIAAGTSIDPDRLAEPGVAYSDLAAGDAHTGGS